MADPLIPLDAWDTLHTLREQQHCTCTGPEIWLPLARYRTKYGNASDRAVRHYEISSLGRIRRGFRILRQFFSGAGFSTQESYLSVTLMQNGTPKRRYMHQLVLEAFDGRRPKKQEVAHWDGKRQHNCYGNLRWTTRADNHNDKKRHGTFVQPPTFFGEDNAKAKLTVREVSVIRRLRKMGFATTDLAELFDMSQGQISSVCTRRTWRIQN